MTCTKAQIAKIRKLLANLPDDEYREQNLTGDQLFSWMSQRTLYELIAECWEAYLAKLDNPLLTLVDEGVISPCTAKLAWLKTERYERLWTLIFLTQRDLREVAACLKRDYPFKSGLEFFKHIVQEQAAKDFEVCLEPYVEISAPKSAAKLRKAAKEVLSSPPEFSTQPTAAYFKNAVEHLSSEYGRDYWTTYAWCVWRVLAQSPRHNDVKRNIAAYDALMDEMASLQARGLRDIESIAWNNGKKMIGQKGGFYQFPDCSHDKETLEAHFDLNQPLFPQIRNNS